MKNNYFDKKLIVLFIIMLIMVSFMFYFLKTNSSQNEDIQTEGVNNIDILEAKKNAINKLLDDIDESFGSDIESFLNDMRSYINLPLKADKVGNNYPFGNYVDTKDENIQNETNKKD